MPELAESVDAARERGFIGRAAQLEAFEASLTGVSDIRVHFLHGPGGIGKSTLLDAFDRRARRAGRRSIYLDARDIPHSRREIAARAAAVPPPAERSPDDVLLIDGFELLAPLDRWFREEFLPSRPRGSVTVLAGRDPPTTGWRVDPGWRALVHVHALTELGRHESQELLDRLGVEASHQSSIMRLARGHPLALAMLAEVSRTGPAPTQLTDAPDVVSQLCRLIVDDIPDEAHRTGLATCAQATRMTIDLLRYTVGPRADEVWAWLESRPYVRRGEVGLFVHDVVRDVFEAEFAQRSPTALSDLHHRVRAYFLQRLNNPEESHPEQAAAELLMLLRPAPLPMDVATMREYGLLPVTLAGRDDCDEVFSLIERGEGAPSAEIARRWVAAQPGCLYRARSATGVEGFGMHIYLPTNSELDVDDPVAAACLRAANEIGPLRPGECIHVNRFSGASGSYRRDPMVLFVNGVSCLMNWANRPSAWSFLVTVDPEYYGPYFEYLGLTRLFTVTAASAECCGFGWDMRRLPPSAFFAMMARRELSGETGPPPADLLGPAPLSQSAFGAAVRAAVQNLRRPDRLATSPLTRTAIVDPTELDPARAVRHCVLSALAVIAEEPHGREYRRVLEGTFLKGPGTQEAAAHQLGLPFSTYRRHLARALARLEQLLWSVEIGEQRLAHPAPDPSQRMGTR